MGRLVRKARLDTQYLSKQLLQHQTQTDLRDAICEQALQMLPSKPIVSAAQVRHQVQQHQDKQDKQDRKISLATVQAVLKQDCNLRFGKVKKIANQANSLRNLYLRQQFGKKVLDLLGDDKRILNVDETWIGQTNFARAEWKDRTMATSRRLNPVMPRITMIAALDNMGDLYISLLQQNSNQYSFCEYMKQLVQQLDQDRPLWRADTVLQLDGAKYHRTALLKDLFQELQVPVMISAPYSYDAAVAELFFAMFKRGELNPMQLGTSKSKSKFSSLTSFFRVFFQCSGAGGGQVQKPQTITPGDALARGDPKSVRLSGPAEAVSK